MGTHPGNPQGGARGQRSYQYDYVELRRYSVGESDDRWRSLAGGSATRSAERSDRQVGISAAAFPTASGPSRHRYRCRIGDYPYVYPLSDSVWVSTPRSRRGSAAAEAAGISIMQNTLRVFFISGALAGLGGAIELTALTRRLFLNFSPGYGYTAIAVALLAKLNPLVTVAAALLFGALSTGSYSMQRQVGISDKVTFVMQATILLFVIGYSSVRLFRKRATSHAE